MTNSLRFAGRGRGQDNNRQNTNGDQLPAEHPDPLRRWWWRTPLAARLLPAVALLTATGAGALSALPAGGQDLATTPPPRTPVDYVAPTTTAPVTTTTTAAETTEAEPVSSPTTSSSRKATTTTAAPVTTITPPAQPTRGPTPPGRDRGRPTTSTTSIGDEDGWVPEVAEGERCSREGDVGRTSSGAAASCERDDHGKLRWTTQW
ncbi:hypothetical protein AB0L88_06680 [Saccharopolyspora shandongensis]|uniref:hypothetical protein n=1 Tax=Saccharopolyspora shandongensis TaxID=418495 RepID=UPI0034382BE4